MRLRVVGHGHRWPQKMMLGVMRVMSGYRAPDIVRTILYRPELWGKSMSAWTQAVMRGPSPWSVAERELFAAFASRLNQCLF